ncbi:MAG: adenylate kinase family enzyme [Neolewinella sp.]|jgi:adenylate kinase family enzyme
MNKGTLIFFCGKMGVGKSTKAEAIANETKAILISEDDWLAAIYPNLISTIEDYKKYSDLLKPQIKKPTQSILQIGQDVLLDFPANTIQQRKWLKEISTEIDAPDILYFLDVSNEVCLEKIKKRVTEEPLRQKTDTNEIFFQMTRYFN